MIINYYGFGKNIILPKFRESPLDENLSFIPIGRDYIYYDFMLEETDNISKDNYNTYFAKDSLAGQYLFNTKCNKYVFK